MRLTFIRFASAFALLASSLQVAAATRYWIFSDVRFADFPSLAVATGSFSYDDATQTITSWNVHVDAANFMPAFTYVPGNSSVSTSQGAGAMMPTLVFSATTVAGLDVDTRYLQITPRAALDGNNAAVSLDTSASREFFPTLMPPRGRSIFSGSLVLGVVPPPAVIVQVDEFYHSGLRHYFITADAAEKQALDAGVHPGWTRTGESFKAYAKGSAALGSIDPVCRYYSPPFIETDFGIFPLGVDSHFFSADANECMRLFHGCCGPWQLENDHAFQIDLPDKATGACTTGTIPVYRLWNQRTDSNHRYTTSPEIKANMLAVGYLAEGYGAGAVAMCAIK